MPCRDPGYDPWERSRADVQKIDKLTRLLCTTLGSMHSKDINNLPKDVQNWWWEHQAADRRRQLREAEEREKKKKKSEALKKLSPEERKLLGI